MTDTPREHLMWSTRELALMREHVDSDDEMLRTVAASLGRSFLTVRGRALRLRQMRDRFKAVAR